MDFTTVIWAVVVLGALAIVFGLILAVAAKVFEVEVDPRLPEIQACLAGANCGGCGYAGCADYAKAIAYSPYISELNGDNRERYRETLVQLYREIEPIYSSLKNNN